MRSTESIFDKNLLTSNEELFESTSVDRDDVNVDADIDVDVDVIVEDGPGLGSGDRLSFVSIHD